MPDLAEALGRALPSGEHLPAAFFVFLSFHVLAGLTCVVSGAVAATSPKRPGRHPRAGTTYYWGLSVVFVTAVGMSALRWPEDAYLLALGTIAFGVASVGFTARKVRWQGWRSVHILGMSLSYVVLLTAFYVDNGPHLPLLDHLPAIVFWIVPGLVGLPLIWRALARHARLGPDLRDTARFLSGRGGATWTA
jgi:hypothetical protein